MARFAAKYAKYRHGVRTGRFMILADGQRQELTKELWARFRRGVLSEQEENVAIAGLNHTGLPHDRDTEEHFSPRSRISGFDSFAAQEAEGWTDEERELVEEVLRKSPANGQEFLELAPEAASRPFQNYDDLPDADTIVTVVRLTGVPVELVLAYERENQNRPEVIEALEGFSAVEDDDEVVVIEA